ncbi:hypothetical protein WH50_02000 [Pokkaliibacter plantistimulans]|uniref:6-phosphogluconolactonase n=1 Tax=Pokkaliibacter plantistimulans TaxID=1635171 RepID=A0ABX5M7R5_9GAMM|nr:6-phosphogluconolactonase [Pokkaliibacter plantistimulans]PXF32940.1 hypothetical protein WH50_02000 [Pokkaliibacter plantistimulans]
MRNYFAHRFHEFNDGEALATALSHRIAQELSNSSTPSLAVSGGRTPTRMFQALAEQECRWPDTLVTLVDERWVDEQHADSNGALVRRHLLQHQAAAATFLPLYQSGEQVSAQATIEETLKQLPAALDVAVLGMGNDGHTASLFPEAEQLAAAMDMQQPARSLFVQPPVAPHLRLTLSRAYLSASKTLILHIQGEDKLATLQQALAEDDEMAMPIRAFLPLPQLEIYWCP